MAQEACKAIILIGEKASRVPKGANDTPEGQALLRRANMALNTFIDRWEIAKAATEAFNADPRVIAALASHRAARSRALVDEARGPWNTDDEG